MPSKIALGHSRNDFGFGFGGLVLREKLCLSAQAPASASASGISPGLLSFHQSQGSVGNTPVGFRV